MLKKIVILLVNMLLCSALLYACKGSASNVVLSEEIRYQMAVWEDVNIHTMEMICMS